MTAIKAKSRRRGFTIIEITIAMLLMSALVYLSMSSHTADQTGKHEAERFEIWLARIIQQAIRTRTGFNMELDGNNVIGIQWAHLDPKKNRSNLNEKFDDKFTATQGCTFSCNRRTITYNAVTNGFSGNSNCTMTVKGNDKDKSKYYVIISTTGRVRLSDSDNDS